INAVSSLFSEHGSDIWFSLPADEILPKGTTCKHCGSNHFTKETDIMDVWFDSGVSHMAVLNERDELSWPADMYLEGSDQYRGWFQSSLLTAVSSKGASPYRNVLSHGWVVDGEGKKQSKSLGNVTDPVEISEKYGADILRLWVSSVDYQSDMRLSPEILKQLSEAYRKIRNTARFILGNLYDFSPDNDSLEEVDELDSWALNRFNQLLDTCRIFYENYEFHGVYHAVHNFCVVDMSNFYLDILKDRLYIENSSSATRRSAQTAIWKILSGLTLLIAPILPFTSEEIWSYLPRSSDYNYEAAVFNQIPESFPNSFNDAIAKKWDNLLEIRDEAKKVLEVSRKDKLIGSSLDAKVIIRASADEINRMKDYADILPKILIVSEVELLTDDNLEEVISISVEKASGHKCERCWSFSRTVGSFDDHPGICDRCREIVTKL
ncbi:MAG: class I tRNA ligase family protein, partial [Ruminococcaceae bacterium]|nr:class I tRNA ligase family protein [Oscillospiraceae bacterium]